MLNKIVKAIFSILFVLALILVNFSPVSAKSNNYNNLPKVIELTVHKTVLNSLDDYLNAHPEAKLSWLFGFTATWDKAGNEPVETFTEIPKNAKVFIHTRTRFADVVTLAEKHGVVFNNITTADPEAVADKDKNDGELKAKAEKDKKELEEKLTAEAKAEIEKYRQGNAAGMEAANNTGKPKTGTTAWTFPFSLSQIGWAAVIIVALAVFAAGISGGARNRIPSPLSGNNQSQPSNPYSHNNSAPLSQPETTQTALATINSNNSGGSQRQRPSSDPGNTNWIPWLRWGLHIVVRSDYRCQENINWWASNQCHLIREKNQYPTRGTATT